VALRDPQERAAEGTFWFYDEDCWALQGPVEQLPPPRHLGVGGIPDLPPHSIGRVGVGQPLGHDPLEIEPLHRGEEVSPSTSDTEHRREYRTGLGD
jgi:hypothetical protein